MTTRIERGAPSPAQNTTFQDTIVRMVLQTVDQIVKEVLTTISDAKESTIDELIKKSVSHKKGPAYKSNQRVINLCSVFLPAVNEDLDKIPGLPDAMIALTAASLNRNLRQILVSNAAMPVIKQLISDLDSLQPSFVDRLITTHSGEKINLPIKKIERLSRSIKTGWESIPSWKKSAAVITGALLIIAFFSWPIIIPQPFVYQVEQAKEIKEKLESLLKTTFIPSSIQETSSKKLSFTAEQLFSQTYEMNVMVDAGKTAIQSGVKTLLNKIDRLIENNCPFEVNITTSDAAKRAIQLILKSNCPI